MKHLPNLLTLGNLFCGCIAIAYIMTALPYYTYEVNAFGPPSYKWVYGVQQMYLGSIFIGIAAICDLLDGFVAKSLKIFSPIGKDLDSLADMVSFGVAPSMIIFQLLWDAQMAEKNVFDVNMLGMVPAFLIACFAALRLAKYNITAAKQQNHFSGMPTPAVGMFVATFPLLVWYNPMGIAEVLKHKWVLYFIVVICCWLMVSNIKFLRLIPAKKNLAGMWPQITLIGLSVLAAVFIKLAAVPFVFALYIILSVIYKFPEETTEIEKI